MRIGVYGGSFNPPHTGHVLAASELLRSLRLDRLLIVPAADPPHKSLPAGSPSPEQRLELCKRSFAGVAGAEVCDLELRRPGKSYTVDTLTTLRERFPEDELCLVMGSDMLLSFQTWREPERIAALAELAAVRRDERPETWEQVLRQAELLRQRFAARIVTVENRCVEISSTTVRRLLAFRAPACLVPEAEALILREGWYLTGADFRNLSLEALRDLVLPLHDEGRRAHVVGTSDTAGALAQRWGADETAARRAGLLHDLTKALGGKEQLHICEKYAMILTPTQRENPKLLHAKTGAVLARTLFGESEAVAEAIRWHTTGRAGMTLLEKILYIADYMEPNRVFSGVEALRELVWRDLDRAVLLGLEQAMAHVRRQGKTLDPDSKAAWEYYRKVTERSE